MRNCSRGAKLQIFEMSCVGAEEESLESHVKELVLKKEIGKGSYGKVYKAVWKGRDVAAKRFHSVFFQNSSFLQEYYMEEFRREWNVLKLLDHPNVVKLHTVLFPKGLSPIIITELLHCDLEKYIRESTTTPKIPEMKLTCIALDVINGLDYMHGLERPVVHRDIATKNILLTEHGNAKIADFGMAKIFEAGCEMYATNVPGTPLYTAPETYPVMKQFEVVRNAKYGPKVDIFSFGAVVMAMIIGHEPRVWPLTPITKDGEMISEHVRRKTDITEMGEHFLKKLVVACLENDSAMRPGTKEIKNVLERHNFEAAWVVLQSSGFETDDEVRIENAECQSSPYYKLKHNTNDRTSTPSARRLLRVTSLADEWGSAKGGLSTLSRELAKHLARQPDVAVTLLLPNCSEKEKQEANDDNVHLALSDDMTEFGPSEDFDIDVVVGHGQKVGAPDQVIAEQHSCKRVHVVHTASEELAMFKKRKKAVSEGEEKHDAEIDLCKEADIVVAIGPKLTEAISASLRPYGKDQDVLNVTPGIFPEFLKLSQAIEEREKFRILVFGRGDSDVFELKGYDIAAQAVASLKDKSYHLLFVGAPKGNEEEVKEYLVDCGISPTQLTVRGFVKSREKLEQLFCEVDLAIMPSRTEGFGLTALEALSAGLPILVSDNSGFGQAIKSVNFGSSFVVQSCDAEEWGKAIRSVREKPRQIRLNEALWLRKFYDEKYEWEPQCERLVSRMRCFFE